MDVFAHEDLRSSERWCKADGRGTRAQ
jgi:hypothetical protein